MTATEEEPTSDREVDRSTWERLRRAALLGFLQPEGARLVDELHELYPAWREEWSQ